MSRGEAGISEVNNSLYHIDVRNAVAYHAADEDMIKMAILQTVLERRGGGEVWLPSVIFGRSCGASMVHFGSIIAASE